MSKANQFMVEGCVERTWHMMHVLKKRERQRKQIGEAIERKRAFDAELERRTREAEMVDQFELPSEWEPDGDQEDLLP